MSASDKIFGWRAQANREADVVTSAKADTKVGFIATKVLEADLRRALLRNQFELYYQPQLDLRTGDILSFEALLRWRHPSKGVLCAGEFIAQAEHLDVMRHIDEWVIHTAIDQALAWDEAGLPPFGMAVNVSTAQFHRPQFADRIAGMLRQKGMSPTRMEIEVTEDVLVGDTSTSINILHALHDLGVAISIDDFGIGYTSLSHMRRFPIDELKIDRTFVHDMKKDERASGVVRSIIELGRSMKFQVLAEGVETTEQLRRLMNMRCERAQGYLISRPMPAAALEQFLDEWPRRWETLIG